MAQNVSLELWLGIGVKHMSFLELWLKMAFLELWLGMTDEHEESLSCGSNWRVVARTNGSKRLLSSMCSRRVW